MITRGSIETIKDIVDCIKEFMGYGTAGNPRLEGLAKYYKGELEILDRVRKGGLPNNKLVHSYPQYIVGVASGYLIGKPVQYSADTINIEGLLEVYRRCDIDSVDSEVAEGASVYGVGVELVYADERGVPKSAAIDRQNAFVIYDDTVEHKAIAGVRWIRVKDSTGELYKLWWYTDKEIKEYRGYTFDSLKEAQTLPHYFGAVPMVEYWNNSKEQGDFEPVISLIDAYNILQSDRVNDKQQFVDSLLMLYGASGIEPPEDENDQRTVAQRLKEDKILAMPVEGKAEYLYKQLNEADVDILRKALKEDIHKFSRVPDLTDESFSGNASGVAMKYKLFGLEQLTKMKERWFSEGLRQRLRLFCEFLRVKGMGSIDPEAIQISFSRSLPVNELEVAQTLASMRGLVPDEILLGQVPFINDVAAVVDMLKQEQEDQAEQSADVFEK